MSSIATGSSPNNIKTMDGIDSWNGTASLCSITNTETAPWIRITMKASSTIDKIVLIPPLGGVGPPGGICPFADQDGINVYIIDKTGNFY